MCVEVLILILMEHAQRCYYVERLFTEWLGLNPYFNGTCSKIEKKEKYNAQILCLNPYFNGTCSKIHGLNSVELSAEYVLILILMEHAQR